MELKDYLIVIVVCVLCVSFYFFSSFSNLAFNSLPTQLNGSNNAIQFNDNGTLNGSSEFTYDSVNRELYLNSDVAGEGFNFNISWQKQLIPGFPLYFPFEFGVNKDASIFGGQNLDYSGENSIVFGVSSTSSGFSSIAIGTSNTASGDYAVAIGQNAQSTGDNAIALNGRALFDNTVAIGLGSESNNFGSLGIGSNSLASGFRSIAIGYNTKATGTGSIAIGDVITNNKNNSLLFGFYNSTQFDILEAELYKGVRIGATSGESINMTGDDLYVEDNTEIGGYLVVGSNTEDGMSEGDINASTIYYDTLVAKSPTFLCEKSTMWCEITVPQYQTSIYVRFTKDWDVMEVMFNGVSYTPIEFRNQLCRQNQKTELVCQEIITKYQKLKQTYQDKQDRKDFIEQCRLLNGKIENNVCFQYEKNTVSYEDATETYEIPVYEQVIERVTKLNDDLEVITVEEVTNGDIIKTKQQVKFRNGCNWDKDISYYCETRKIIAEFT